MKGGEGKNLVPADCDRDSLNTSAKQFCQPRSLGRRSRSDIILNRRATIGSCWAPGMLGRNLEVEPHKNPIHICNNVSWGHRQHRTSAKVDDYYIDVDGERRAAGQHHRSCPYTNMSTKYQFSTAATDRSLKRFNVERSRPRYLVIASS